jgi:hypothetical protein
MVAVHRRVVAAVAAVPLLLGFGSPAQAASSRTFPHPLQIDNRLFSLVPGTQYIFDGTVTDDEGTHRHRIVFTVTDMAKKVDGVWTRVIWDQDFDDGELSEAELTFFAQNRNADVLTMGEYPEEYEDGEFAGAPSAWISGRERARAGILVPGHPTVGQRFVQGRAPVADFYDVGVVKSLHTRACAPVGCFGNARLIEESSPLTPEDGKQLKYYVPNVGLVRIGAVGGDSREVLTLTKVRHLSSAQRAKAGAAVLKLEARAYRVSAPYRQTARMRRCPVTC